jgi:hypothetical protein
VATRPLTPDDLDGLGDGCRAGNAFPLAGIAATAGEWRREWASGRRGDSERCEGSKSEVGVGVGVSSGVKCIWSEVDR